ncbi:MAG: hypothetical protein H0U19_05595, partial [Acidobacteria bacterium]|nr:hypothetical protein [Acidobacteriota bacterium]
VIGEAEEVIARNLEQWDAALEGYRDHDEVVFWFEHDLFDQLILVRHLHWLSMIDRAGTRFSLVCVGGYAGIGMFTGLGQLRPGQLAMLFPERQPISDAQIAIGSHTWNLFRAPDPGPLAEWLSSSDTSLLPFLESALRRHLEDFPSSRDGLSRSERQILRTLVDGPRTPADIFVATGEMEDRVFMGDATFWSIVRGLSRGLHPLVTLDRNESRMPIVEGHVEITPEGRDVLAGAVDHIGLNGVDRWMGGAHLTSGRHWRWDGSRLHSLNSQLPTPNSQPPTCGGLNVASGAEGGTHSMAPEDDDREFAGGTAAADTGGGDEDPGMEGEVGGGWRVVGGGTGEAVGSGDTSTSGGGGKSSSPGRRSIKPRVSVRPAKSKGGTGAGSRSPKAPIKKKPAARKTIKTTKTIKKTKSASGGRKKAGARKTSRSVSKKASGRGAKKSPGGTSRRR